MEDGKWGEFYGVRLDKTMTKQNIFTRISNKVENLMSAKSFTGWLFNSLGSSTSWNGKDFLRANEISLYVNKAIEKEQTRWPRHNLFFSKKINK